jgi:hypothetical protein
LCSPERIAAAVDDAYIAELARAVAEALGGIVARLAEVSRHAPSFATARLATGLGRFEAALDAELDAVASGASVFKAVRGRCGAEPGGDHDRIRFCPPVRA